jgi:hypothetical protein
MSLTPSTNELVILGAPVALRDGSRVRVRQGHRSDRKLLLDGFERLSPESRYRRFLAVQGVRVPRDEPGPPETLTDTDYANLLRVSSP